MKNIETVISERSIHLLPVTAGEKSRDYRGQERLSLLVLALTPAKHPPNKDSANPV